MLAERSIDLEITKKLKLKTAYSTLVSIFALSRNHIYQLVSDHMFGS